MTKEAYKTRIIEQLDVLLYWAILIISILGNFIVSIALVPFLVALQGWALYFTVFFIAATFGYMFTFVLQEIEKLQPQQNVIAIILIPAIAVINITIMTLMSNKLILLLDVNTAFHNPYLVAAVYVLGYLLPGGVRHISRKALKTKQ